MPPLSATAPAPFGPVEIEAIRIGAREGVRRSASLLARLFEAATGIRVTRPLANPRLELLRQFAARARCRGHLTAAERGALEAAGYPADQAVSLLARLVPCS